MSEVKRDRNGKAYLLHEGKAYYGAPPVNDKYKSNDRRNPDKQYAECPITGQIFDSTRDDWWRDHWARLAEEQTKVKPPSGANRELISKVTGYSREVQYGEIHVRNWNRVLAALGVNNGYVPMSPEEMQDCYKHFSKNRWGPVLEALGFARPDSPQIPSPQKTSGEAQQTLPYVYGEDLENARRAAGDEHNQLHWIAITGEIDYRMTNKATIPPFITSAVIDEVETAYPKIRLDNVRRLINEK